MAEIQQMHYSAEFNRLIGEYKTKLESQNPGVSIDLLAKKVVTAAFKEYLLLCYSEKVRSERFAPWEPLTDRQGAELAAIEKHHWLPEHVRAMSNDDLLLALNNEIQSFQLSGPALEACSGWLNNHGLNAYIRHLQSPSKSNELDD
ncbi:hypothetical protein K7H09_23510 [Halomonas sp. IOP_14]|uniref:hypothetical protein n=1 Tax=Halomonas sp. IOP_14 TaxID=2873295 RepID=UPI001E60D8B8|nr:hypothetical protein [Halomonas sp. IOP_14]MCD1588974.1 hypothetical protein [Halomonas sp. IOP_14]